jgi:hypothetical protein
VGWCFSLGKGGGLVSPKTKGTYFIQVGNRTGLVPSGGNIELRRGTGPLYDIVSSTNQN